MTRLGIDPLSEEQKIRITTALLIAKAERIAINELGISAADLESYTWTVDPDSFQTNIS